MRHSPSMRYTLLFILTLSFTFLSACSTQNNHVYDLDSGRQVAVNKILQDDTYIQYDGYDFKELVAEKTTCDTCYHYIYTFNIDEEYLTGIKGYMTDVSVKNNIITSIKYTEISSGTSSEDSLPAIADRFDEFCENKCGDGFCNEIVCQDSGCICEENKENCPEDC
jgi:hypothetical protein